MNNIAVCTQSLLQKYLREVHNINVLVEVGWKDGKFIYGYSLWVGFKDNFYEEKYNTYEEALQEGLIRGLNLIK